MVLKIARDNKLHSEVNIFVKQISPIVVQFASIFSRRVLFTSTPAFVACIFTFRALHYCVPVLEFSLPGLQFSSRTFIITSMTRIIPSGPGIFPSRIKSQRKEIKSFIYIYFYFRVNPSFNL